MKNQPPHPSQAHVRSAVLLLLTVAMSLSVLLSMAASGHDGVGPLAQPLQPPGRFGP